MHSAERTARSAVNVFQVDPFADTRWLGFLEKAPGVSVFHHPAWLGVLRDTYGYAPACLMAAEADRSCGVLPLMEVRSWLTGKRAVSLPFSDTCGLIADGEPAARALLEAAEDLRCNRKWRYVELRDSVVPDGFGPSARYKLHRTDLVRDPQALLKTFNQHTRRKLRRAETMGVQVTRRSDDEALRAFVRLNALTRRKHGVLPQPDAFFWNIQKNLLNPGLGFLGVATLDRQIVATNLFLYWKGTVVYKYGASDDRALPAAANYAVMWDALRWGCQHDFSVFDFGRSDLAGEGLLQFKRGWGSQELDLVYARRNAPLKDEVSDQPGLHERLKPLISRMPVSILKLIGRRAYAHVG